jgi:hypothetical protein
MHFRPGDLFQNMQLLVSLPPKLRIHYRCLVPLSFLNQYSFTQTRPGDLDITYM